MEKKKLNDKFNPKDFEDRIYSDWEKKGYFKPNMDKTKESYCIMMPPPNVTGKLHSRLPLLNRISRTRAKTNS